MGLINSISQRIGKNVAPLEEAIVFKVPISEFQKPIQTSLQSQFVQTQILRLTNPILFQIEISDNLNFSFDEILGEIEFTRLNSPRVFESRLIKFEEVSNVDVDFTFECDSKSSFVYANSVCEWGETKVTENLFKKLVTQKVAGKNYKERIEQKAKQKSLFDEDFEVNIGFRKAYRKKKDSQDGNSHTSQELGFWDLLFPILMPPIDSTFSSSFELFRPLFAFQPAGIDFLVKNTSALLADEMGTGKTVMSSVALKILFRLGKVRKALIVCPVSLLNTWHDHLNNWADELELTVVRGTPEVRKLDWKFSAHVYLTTYDTIASDFFSKTKRNTAVCPKCKFSSYIGKGDAYFFCTRCTTFVNSDPPENESPNSSILDSDIIRSFDVVILDEAQYIKNKSSKRSRAVRLLSPTYRWALSGTPIENRLEDLLAIFRFVKPTLFGNSRDIAPYTASTMIQPYFLRRLKKDVMKDLPPKVIQELWLDLDEDQKRAYRAVEQANIEELEELGQHVTKFHIFSRLHKLKQICNFAPNKTRSSKTTELLDLVEQIKESGQKVIVFSQYDTEGVSKIEPLLKEFGVVVLKGGMNDINRHTVLKRFKKDLDICVLLATIKTGGVGLTLTEASYVIHFDHWWNPAVIWQANDRVHRSGQTATQVNIYSFWIKDTIEERIYNILHEKGLLFDEVINGLSIDAVDSMLSIEDWLNIIGVNSKSSQKSNSEKSSNQSKKKSSNPKSATEHPFNAEDLNKKQNVDHDFELLVFKRLTPEIAHQILGLKIGAITKKQITSAYRDLARKYHPDTVYQEYPHLTDKASEKMKQINAAYEFLKRHNFI